jgi:hypothetical protein
LFKFLELINKTARLSHDVSAVAESGNLLLHGKAFSDI